MGKFKRAWVIDDSWLDSFAIKRLMKYTNFSDDIVSYRDGYEALNQLTLLASTNAEEFPDAILLDIKMPIWDAWKFLDFFNELGITKPINFFIISTSGQSEFEEQMARYENISKFYHKPIRTKDLREMMEMGGELV